MLALEFVTDALRGIGVLSEIDSPSAEQGQDGVRKFNELMASLAEDGIDLGWAPIANTASTVVIPLGHVATIKALLGKACAPLYGAEVPGAVAQTADQGYRRLLNQAISMQIERAQSETLPIGQNYYGNGRFSILRGY